ncbi:TonB-dependent receptor [Aquisalinus flavus]|uniref:TonB-dependent receptor n=1 Tax=Aquisalinus flavus TaxID=1526572 RepID=A0A8J2V6D0_9PROT|nr:TonB-dependent receptor [Aquisalinus flavus]MBD0425988.1 TonB-dependent receptor [Aquisalinus flavus]GGD11604.1 TonB-dependent receptor [Aquisalinus flavus]
MLATGALAQDNDNEEDDVIVVQGIRQSILDAKEQKRNADSVIDAITATDIGNFADDNLTDAVQRIPGVQVERDEAGTDGDRISIRGLGPQFVTNTVNGRAVLSSGTEGLGNLRSVNIGAFPAEIVSGVEVQKTPMASSPEFGLAGAVDIKTLRPLDSPALSKANSFANITVRAEEVGLERDLGYRVSGAAGFKNGAGDFGAYISAVYGDTDRVTDQVNYQSIERGIQLDDNNDGVADRTETLFVPTAFQVNPINDAIERVAVSAGAQWMPSEDLTLTFDTTYTSIDTDSFRNNFVVLFNRTWARPVRTDDVVIDENSTLQQIDLSNVGLSPLLRSQPLIFRNKTDNLISGVSADYVQGNFTHRFDVYLSTIEYMQNLRFSLHQQANWDTSGVVLTSQPFDVANLTGLGSLATSPDGYSALFGIGREIGLEADQLGFSYDGAYEPTDGFFTSFEGGLRYTQTDLDSRRSIAEQFQNSGATAVEISQAAATGELASLAGDIDGFAPEEWWVADINRSAEFQPGLLTATGDDLGTDPLASFGVEENVLALYGQARFAGEAGSLPFDGNVGIRAVNTDLTTTGSAIGDGFDDPQAVEFKGDNWEYLPTANLRFMPSDEFAIRLAAGRSLSRANFDELSPRIQVSPAEEDPEFPDAVGVRRAQAGNPDLKPMTAWNYDATFEWYPNESGAYVVSVFYKDVNDFIIDQSTLGTIQGLGDEEFLIRQPVNFSKGQAQGFEIGFIQDFSILPSPWHGFGASANYTYVKSEFDEDVGDAGFGFPGSSENNYNAQVYYEDGPVTLRAAYTYRDDYFRLLAGTGTQNNNARFTQGFGSLDLTGRWRFNDHLQATVQGLNVTGETRRDFVGVETNFLDHFDRGRSVIFSLRAQM